MDDFGYSAVVGVHDLQEHAQRICLRNKIIHQVTTEIYINNVIPSSYLVAQLCSNDWNSISKINISTFLVELKYEQKKQIKDFDSETGANDIALIKLAWSAQLDEWTNPACIMETEISPEAVCVATGWGSAANNVLYYPSKERKTFENASTKILILISSRTYIKIGMAKKELSYSH